MKSLISLKKSCLSPQDETHQSSQLSNCHGLVAKRLITYAFVQRNYRTSATSAVQVVIYPSSNIHLHFIVNSFEIYFKFRV